MKKGFTLVELSIVLVIIGLLIGGILAAQSMISTSKIQSFTRQVGQLDAVTSNFKTTYGQNPGDTSLLGVVKGNDDGVMNHGGGCSNWNGEIAKYWADLSQIGFVNPKTGTAYTDDSGMGNNMATSVSTKLPAAVLGTNAYIMAAGVSTDFTYYVIGSSFTGTSGAQIQNGTPFKPSEALAVDQKLDDGAANSGNIIGIASLVAFESCGTTAFNSFSSANNCATTNGGNTYKVANTTDTCALAIRVGASQGNLR